MKGLRKKRLKKGYSMVKLGQLVGVTRQAVYRWEVGTSSASPLKLEKLAEIFGCSVKSLF